MDFDPKHVIYVWIDALTNYITGIGYDPDGSSPQFEQFWPADVHIIGKDILRFHTIYWPIMLMALDLPLPKQVFGHPWLLFSQEKMSKSRGNVIYADDLCRHFGVDGVRYYLLKEMPFGSDGSITYETVIARYNSDLANTLGNLVNRTVAMTNKYFGGKVSRPAAGDELDAQLTGLAESTIGEYHKLMAGFRVADALEAILNLARRANKYIDETAPWALAKDEANRDKLEGVLYRLLEVIRYLGVLLQPFMPDTAEKIFAQIGSQTKTLDSLNSFGAEESYAVGKAEPLFARIDEAKKLAELEEEAKAKAPKEEKKEEVPGIVQIGIEDFAKVELRAAKITACEPIPKAKKLLKLTLDDGTGTPPDGGQRHRALVQAGRTDGQNHHRGGQPEARQTLRRGKQRHDFGSGLPRRSGEGIVLRRCHPGGKQDPVSASCGVHPRIHCVGFVSTAWDTPLPCLRKKIFNLIS